MKESPEKILKINGTGCGLLDYLYTKVDYSDEGFRKYLSLKEGDGGIVPGKLVFSEDLEDYAGEDSLVILRNIVGEREPDAVNIGGPALVALIHLFQMDFQKLFRVNYFGSYGNDADGRTLNQLLERTGFNTTFYKMSTGKTPSTMVLSDPSFNKGEGERAFVNTLGVADDYLMKGDEEDFFNADILLFGGTALSPAIHRQLSDLLKTGRERKCINVVSTVYDFQSERNNPGSPWPMGGPANSYPFIDLLVMDEEEAYKISGRNSVDDACSFFIDRGTGAFIITRGAKDVLCYSNGGLFRKTGIVSLPVLDLDSYRQKDRISDTTGCGDNFAGGVLFSLAGQLLNGKREGLDLQEACSWGIASGAFTALIAGGVKFEDEAGEKYRQILEMLNDYKKRGKS